MIKEGQEVNNTFNEVTLIVLAAGMGDHFGGLKQLIPIGSKKQTILEYTLDDAQSLGIRKVVFLVRSAIEEEFREVVLSKLYRKPFEIQVVIQHTDEVPEEFQTLSTRERPWGTGYAAKIAFEACRTPSAVLVNADDYYGPNALKAAAQAAAWGRNAIIGWPIEKTLSTRGPVSRGIIKVGKYNELIDIEERHGLTKANTPKNVLVSMNCIALAPSIKKPLEDNWLNFCANGGTNTLNKDCYLPDALREAVRQGEQIEVVATQDNWLGLTHRDDITEVDLQIGRLAGA